MLVHRKSTDFRCFSNAPNLLRQQDDLWSLYYKVIMILEFQIELYVFEWKRIFHPASAKKSEAIMHHTGIYNHRLMKSHELNELNLN